MPFFFHFEVSLRRYASFRNTPFEDSSKIAGFIVLLHFQWPHRGGVVSTTVIGYSKYLSGNIVASSLSSNRRGGVSNTVNYLYSRRTSRIASFGIYIQTVCGM